MSCSQVHSLTLLYCCKVSRKTLFNEHQTLWGFSRTPNRYYIADMALHILGKNLKRIIGCLDGRALLFFQTFPSFFFSSFDSGDLVEGRFFLKLSVSVSVASLAWRIQPSADVWFLCSTFCVFQIRRQLKSCSLTSLFIVSWI